MLREKEPQISAPKQVSLSVGQNQELSTILEFIDKHIVGFRAYFQIEQAGDKENRITDLLVHHLQYNKSVTDDYLPYDFRKNPTQKQSAKETDMGVYALSKIKISPFVTLIEFEAKRLSGNSNNKEYVCGQRGGMERIKREEHCAHLKECGMFGYVQKGEIPEWVEKINGWIVEQATNNQDASIDWKGDKEKLQNSTVLGDVGKYRSENKRIKSNDNIRIWHYFILLH